MLSSKAGDFSFCLKKGITKSANTHIILLLNHEILKSQTISDNTAWFQQILHAASVLVSQISKTPCNCIMALREQGTSKGENKREKGVHINLSSFRIIGLENIMLTMTKLSRGIYSIV
jgi:hypothetical protein